MDTAVTNLASEPAMTAALLALAIALTEIIKQAVGALTKKYTKGGKDTVVLQLDPEASRVIHATDDKVTEIRAVVTRTNPDGTPLIYHDKAVSKGVETMGEVLKQLANSQERLADSMSRLDSRFEAHDRSDAITFSRLVDAQERLENIGNQNRETMIELKKDYQSNLSKMDQLIQISNRNK